MLVQDARLRNVLYKSEFIQFKKFHCVATSRKRTHAATMLDEVNLFVRGGGVFGWAVLYLWVPVRSANFVCNVLRNFNNFWKILFSHNAG